jgi:hypothetical protein
MIHPLFAEPSVFNPFSANSPDMTRGRHALLTFPTGGDNLR